MKDKIKIMFFIALFIINTLSDIGGTIDSLVAGYNVAMNAF